MISHLLETKQRGKQINAGPDLCGEAEEFSSLPFFKMIPVINRIQKQQM
jgi:hypothetical protein